MGMSETSRIRFQRRYRLTRAGDFQRVYKKGRRARSAHFTVFFQGNQLTYSRFGLTVSKKLGPAVRRNRIKRIFREALRFERRDAMPGYDFVFNPYSSAATLKSPALAKDLAKLFAQLKEKL